MLFFVVVVEIQINVRKFCNFGILEQITKCLPVSDNTSVGAGACCVVCAVGCAEGVRVSSSSAGCKTTNTTGSNSSPTLESVERLNLESVAKQDRCIKVQSVHSVRKWNDFS